MDGSIDPVALEHFIDENRRVASVDGTSATSVPAPTVPVATVPAPTVPVVTVPAPTVPAPTVLALNVPAPNVPAPNVPAPTVATEEEELTVVGEELVCRSSHVCINLEAESFKTYAYLVGRMCSGLNCASKTLSIPDAYTGPANMFRCYPCKDLRLGTSNCNFVLCCECYDLGMASTHGRRSRRSAKTALEQATNNTEV